MSVSGGIVDLVVIVAIIFILQNGCLAAVSHTGVRSQRVSQKFISHIIKSIAIGYISITRTNIIAPLPQARSSPPSPYLIVPVPFRLIDGPEELDLLLRP